jgi:hypothetical protein
MRQGAMTEDEIKAAEDAGKVPGIEPELKAPVIVDPSDAAEVNLHGGVPGSPYSSNPGEVSMEDARKQDEEEAATTRAEDDAQTRMREIESQRTGVPTETLAAQEDEPEPEPKRSSSRSSKK